MTDQAKERALWFAYSCTECGALYPHPSFKCGGIGGFNDHPEAGTRLVKVVPASALEERDRVLGELRGALAELVRLKDGPRDEEYHQLKPEAWDRARVALARTTQGGEAVVPGVNSTPARIETRPTLSPSKPCTTWEDRAAEAERRLGIAREALERIADGWTDPHYHARAALDGEGEE